MPRLAICMSGHVSVARMSGRLDDILAGYAKAFAGFRSHDYFLSLSYSDAAGNDLAKRLLHHFQPKAHSVEKDTAVDVPAAFLRRQNGNAEHALKMFSKIRKANDLKRSSAEKVGTKYAYTVRCRPDMVFVDRVVVPVALQLRLCDVVIPVFPWAHVEEFERAQTDWFALGRTAAMDKYAETELHLGSLVQAGILFHAETLLGNHLHMQGIRTLQIPSPCFFDPQYRELNGYRKAES